MLSEQKLLLRISECISIAGSLGSLLVALHCYLGGSAEVIEPASIAGLVLLIMTFGPACALAEEYVRTVHRPARYTMNTAGLSSGDISAIVEWAPSAYKFAAILGVGIAVFAGLAFGSASWSSDRPLGLRDGIAGGLGLSAFFLLALPVLASAVRMQGSYAKTRRNDA